MKKFKQFVQLAKIDVQKREVWGVAALEQPDRAREIMDYEKSLPNFINWSRDMEKASGGKSLGNVRAMHNDVAAGKVIHFEPRDDSKSFFVGTKIVDDNEWRKVLEGVYTGFSVGGSYGAKWPDPVLKGFTRYEAKPVEISLVDTPCMPGAQFEIIKADGSVEMRKFASVDEKEDADLEKGDFDGHPFRGNQYMSADDMSVGGVVEDTNPFSGKYTVSHSFLKDIDDNAEIMGTDKKMLDFKQAVETSVNKILERLKSSTQMQDAAKQDWLGFEVALDDVFRKQIKKEWGGDVNINYYGQNEKGKTLTGFSARTFDDIVRQLTFQASGIVKKSPPISYLLKGVNMSNEELLAKLNASSDPAMQELAQTLTKAFPPAKKEDEKADDAKAKPDGKDGNPFNGKSKADDAAAEGETEEHENAETDEEEAQEDATGTESDEQTNANEPTPDQTEAIRAVVIQLLEELGFVQEQGNQMKMAAPIADLQKRDGDLQKAYDALATRNKELTTDLAKLQVTVDEMEKRGGPAPVIRDLGLIGSQGAGELQKVAILKDMIAKTTDPTIRQALQNDLATLEIKHVQSNKPTQ